MPHRPELSPSEQQAAANSARDKARRAFTEANRERCQELHNDKMEALNDINATNISYLHLSRAQSAGESLAFELKHACFFEEASAVTKLLETIHQEVEMLRKVLDERRHEYGNARAAFDKEFPCP